MGTTKKGLRHQSVRDVIERDRKRFGPGRSGYAEFLATMDRLRREHHATRTRNGETMVFETNDDIAAYGYFPPEEMSYPYDLSDEAIDQGLEGVQRKYLLRFKNIRRSWARLLKFLPEAMGEGRALDILEMSTAHGATLEILRHFGHRVVGNDFSNVGLQGDRTGTATTHREFGDDVLAAIPEEKASWPYKPIIDALDLDVRLFDAGIAPYPFEDDAFDVVLCFDALEHYCHPSEWMKVIDEFVRISRGTVVIEKNPVPRRHVHDAVYMEACMTFFEEVLRYDRRGFRCIASGTSFNQPRFFKLMRV